MHFIIRVDTLLTFSLYRQTYFYRNQIHATVLAKLLCSAFVLGIATISCVLDHQESRLLLSNKIYEPETYFSQHHRPPSKLDVETL